MSDAAPGALFDAHAHVQVQQFDQDREVMLQRARDAGVAGIVCSSDDLASSVQAVAMAERTPGVWATVGVHPHEAHGYDREAEEQLVVLAQSKSVVAIGEIGLDYYRDLSPRDVQRKAFELQLQLAVRLDLPVVVHSREAAEDTFSILSSWRSSFETGPSLMHCFGYDTGWAERLLGLGFMISIPGTVTYPRAATVQSVAAMVPESMLTIETDCPYLAPQSRRGKRNEPAYLVETVAAVATLRQAEPARLAESVTSNARRLFRLQEG